MKKEYIAYRGEYFTIEWYFDMSGKSQSYEFLLNLDDNTQQQVFYLFKRIADFGQIKDIRKFRNEGDKIYTFKPQPDRFLSFFTKDKKIIVTNAFTKKSDKLPKSEKIKAIQARNDYINRNSKGTYYEK
jgi:phage-related protein